MLIITSIKASVRVDDWLCVDALMTVLVCLCVDPLVRRCVDELMCCARMCAGVDA